ncbi:MAG: DUF721 domain-containing protein [Desulfotalea sp.]
MEEKTAHDIASVLPKIIKKKGWQVELERYDIFKKWTDFVGEDVAEVTKPLKVDRNILFVEVENSAWMQQLQYQKIGILEDLNAFLKLSRFSDIKFVLESGRKKIERPEPPMRSYNPPTPEEFEAFCKKTEWIADEPSREALRKFWYLYKAWIDNNNEK